MIRVLLLEKKEERKIAKKKKKEGKRRKMGQNREEKRARKQATSIADRDVSRVFLAISLRETPFAIETRTRFAKIV